MEYLALRRIGDERISDSWRSNFSHNIGDRDDGGMKIRLGDSIF